MYALCAHQLLRLFPPAEHVGALGCRKVTLGLTGWISYADVVGRDRLYPQSTNFERWLISATDSDSCQRRGCDDYSDSPHPPRVSGVAYGLVLSAFGNW
jgi:hypothetical protein